MMKWGIVIFAFGFEQIRKPTLYMDGGILFCLALHASGKKKTLQYTAVIFKSLL